MKTGRAKTVTRGAVKKCGIDGRLKTEGMCGVVRIAEAESQ